VYVCIGGVGVQGGYEHVCRVGMSMCGCVYMNDPSLL